MNFDRMRSLLIDRALRGELFSYSKSVTSVEKSLNEQKTIPFPIPNNWQWKCVADCVQFNPKVVSNDTVEVSFIPMADVEPGFVDQCSTKQTKPWAKVKKGFSRFQEGDLLVAKITPCFQNRKSCIAKNLIHGIGAGSTEFHVMRCVSDVDTKFLLYFFKSEYFIRYGVNHFNGTVGQQRVGAQDIKDCLIPVPSFEEQTQIVAKLEEAFAEIDRAEKAYEELQTLAGVLRGQILQEAIQGKLVSQLDSEDAVEQIGDAPEKVPFTIPSSWKWRSLEEIFKFIDYRGKTPTKSTEGIRLMTASNVRQGYIDHKRVEFISTEEYASRQSRGVSQKGDLLFTTEAPLGNVAIADLETYSAGQRVITLQTDSENKKLLMYFMLSPYFQKALKDNATGTTAQGIKAARLKKMLLPVPPLEEQNRIVDKVDDLLNQVDVLSGK